MAEASLMSEGKEQLRKRLEELQREYEKTAQRLQRAERKEAVRRHVQNRICDQNRLLQIDTLGLSQTSFASSFVSNSELLCDQTLPLGTKPQDGFPSAKKVPHVRFDLPDGLDASPCSTTTCRRGPTHRLRSKRSRLRLQSREKESDTDSQGKVIEDVEERLREQIDQEKEDEWTNKENSLDMGSVGEKVKSNTGREKTEEVKQNGWKEKDGDGESDEIKQRTELKDGLIKREDNPDVGLQMITNSDGHSPDNCLLKQSPVDVFPLSQLEVTISPTNQSANRSQSTITASDQLFMHLQSCPSAGLSDQSNDQNKVDTEEEGRVAQKTRGDMMTFSVSPEKVGFPDSCTVIEGLPFPVEYYIRTTRRMAAALSPVDLDAVIHSQLSRGRGRRRSQRQAAGQLSSETSHPVVRTLDPPRRRGNGRRGRRGCRGRRKSTQELSTNSPAVPCAGSGSEQSDSLPEPATQSLLQSQSYLPVEPLPQSKSVCQAEPVPTSDTAMNTQPVAADFKHLSDSQQHLNCKVLPDSEVYPIFKRRHSQTERVVSSQTQTSTNDSRPHLLSLASLAQFLRMKNFRHFGQVLTTFDIQDFHLPDNEFGQLKLERLRMSCSNMEPLISCSSMYNTRHCSRRHTLRSGSKGNNEVACQISGKFSPEALGASLEGSFPLSQMSFADQSVVMEEINQLEKQTGTAKQDLGSIKWSSTEQLDQSSKITENLQTSEVLLPKLLNSATEDKETPLDKKLVGLELEENPDKHTLLQTHSHSPTEAESPCPLLNLSMSLTSHTQQCGPDSSFPSLGITPHLLTPISPSDLTPLLSSPSEKSLALSSQHAEHVSSAVATSSHTARASQNVCQDMAQTKNQTPIEIQAPSVLRETSEPAREVLLSPKKMNLVQRSSNVHNADSENENKTKDKLEADAEWQEIIHVHSLSEHEVHVQTENQTHRLTEPKPEDQAQSVVLSSPHSPCVDKDSGSARKPYNTNVTSALPNSSTPHNANVASISSSDEAKPSNMPTNHMPGMTNPTHLNAQAAVAETFHQSKPAEASHHSDEDFSCGSLQKTHTLKVLEGECVLDMCLVRWPLDDWCICVAREWSVCVWAHKAGMQQWKLLHTWTFTQYVISVQGIPDSSGLLCVSLGRPEVTEASILCCPGFDGEFSQTELYKGALQAVVAVSDCRLVCCSAPGAQQKVQVFTLTQDGRIAHTLCLAPANQSIQTLAVVEGKKDALVGWSECKTLLIWNMKTGQLLQAIQMAEAMPGATCLRGYSHRGVLCVLLQSARAFDACDGSPLFTLIAINPLTCRYITLTSISNTAPYTERYIGGDVCESMLVGVFQSGHLTIWDLRGGVSSVVGGGAGQLCQLARWAGPNTLLTGYLNGIINLYQYKATKT